MTVNIITLLLTILIAAATIAYTYSSFLLWKTSRASTEIARQLALASMWVELNRYIAMVKKDKPPEAEFLDKFSNIMAELILANLIKDLRADNERSVKTFNRKLDDLISSTGFDTRQIEWFEPFVNRQK